MVALRRYSQIFFVLLSLYLWYKLYLFVRHFDTGGVTEYVPRPQGVDAFLPIGGLVALKHLVINNSFDRTHPVALVSLLAILAVALLYRRAFCSWICPVGALSEAISSFGRRLSLQITPPKFLHYPLLSLKYLLLLFFIKIVIDMPAEALPAFLNSPYYKIVDAKLLDFWIHPGKLTVTFVLVIMALTVFIRNFWCLYLCPYGALLGILGVLGISRVERDENLCTHCRICELKCPYGIEVHKKQQVRIPECSGCWECVNSCPPRALKFKVAKQPVSYYTFAALVLATFLGILALAKLLGYWNSSVSYAEYAHLLPMRGFISH